MGATSTTATPPTGIVYDPCYLRHEIAPGHPESPRRLGTAMERLASSGLLPGLTRIPPLTDAGAVEAAILRVHSQEHFDSVKHCAVTGDVALRAVAGACAAIDAVITGSVRNVFCALRPPGHHAHDNGADYDGPGEGQGFCFLNNIAIAARYAQQVHGLRRVLILDWDFHHGNGTEWAFYEDPSVFFFSTHALFAYPGTGYPERRGAGAGKGYNLNVPLPPGACDKEILDAWTGTLLPRLRDIDFQPDLVLISAGFDSREDDYLGNFAISDEGFAELTRIAMRLADQRCGGRLVSMLEGGYNPEGLASAVVAHVGALCS